MRRRERWPARKERDRMRDDIADAGGISAWIRAGRPRPEEDRARKTRMNALAEKRGMAWPYPEVGEDRPPECDP